MSPRGSVAVRPRSAWGAEAVSLDRGPRFTGSCGTWAPSAAATQEAWAGTSSEERELASLRARDEAAFLALVCRHQSAMLRVASAYVKSRASAEEVVQEAWLGVLKGLHQFEGRCSLKAWIFRILVNCAKTRAVREQRTVPFSGVARVGEEGRSSAPERFLDEGERWAGRWAEPPEPWPDASVESGELAALVRDAMERLPGSQRTVMALRDVEGWHAEEVCELLGITAANQRVLLHRARSRVRRYVEGRLGSEHVR